MSRLARDEPADVVSGQRRELEHLSAFDEVVHRVGDRTGVVGLRRREQQDRKALHPPCEVGAEPCRLLVDPVQVVDR